MQAGPRAFVGQQLRQRQDALIVEHQPRRRQHAAVERHAKTAAELAQVHMQVEMPELHILPHR